MFMEFDGWVASLARDESWHCQPNGLMVHSLQRNVVFMSNASRPMSAQQVARHNDQHLLESQSICIIIIHFLDEAELRVLVLMFNSRKPLDLPYLLNSVQGCIDSGCMDAWMHDALVYKKRVMALPARWLLSDSQGP
eukprot:UN4208